MLKVTAYSNSILCVEDTATRLDITRELTHAQLMACLAHIQALTRWQCRAADGPQYGMVIYLRVLPKPEDWAVWEPAFLHAQDGQSGIYESGFPTAAAAQEAIPRIRASVNAHEGEDLPPEHFVVAPTPTDYHPGTINT